MLTVSTWLWGEKFDLSYVERWVASIGRNLSQPHELLVISDRPLNLPDGVRQSRIVDPLLTRVAGCFARLRMFDPAWQEAVGVRGRIAMIDLDTVITGPLDPVFDRDDDFVIMQGGNAVNPCPYNGALMMLRAGAHSGVWTDFSLEAAQDSAFHEFPDDQGWIWHKLPNAAGWKCGNESGVYVFQKPGWPDWQRKTEALPAGARLVTFSGKRNPKRYSHLDWVRQHWRK